MGNENNLYFEFGGETTVARVTKYDVSQIGDDVTFVFMPHKLHFFDIETEEVTVDSQAAAKKSAKRRIFNYAIGF